MVLCNVSRDHYEEHFCEIILNLDQMLLIGLSIFSSGGHSDHRSVTICASLIADIMKNIYLKLFEIWTSGSREVC